MKKLGLALILSLILGAAAFAVQGGTPAGAPASAQGQVKDPCKQIKMLCEGAGFAPHEAKAGKGLFVDCVKPILHGGAPNPKATLALPQVDPTLVSACLAKHPNMGK